MELSMCKLSIFAISSNEIQGNIFQIIKKWNINLWKHKLPIEINFVQFLCTLDSVRGNHLPSGQCFCTDMVY